MERPRHTVYAPQEWQVHHHAARRQLKNGVRALRYACAAILQGRQRRQRCYQCVFLQFRGRSMKEVMAGLKSFKNCAKNVFVTKRENVGAELREATFNMALVVPDLRNNVEWRPEWIPRIFQVDNPTTLNIRDAMHTCKDTETAKAEFLAQLD